MSSIPKSSSALALPLMESEHIFVGRAKELHLFVQHIVHAQEPLYRVISIWGEPGVGTSTLLRRFYDEARLATGTYHLFTAFVDEYIVSPRDMLERWAFQLRLAGVPLPLFERLLAAYKEAEQSWDADLEAARTILTHDPLHGTGAGIEGVPVIGGFYAMVAQAARVPLQKVDLTSFSTVEAELIEAFVEDLDWQTNSFMSPQTMRAKRPYRVILFCDAEGPMAAAAMSRLLPHLLKESKSTNVVVVVAGQAPIDHSAFSEYVFHTMPLARFTEEETYAYLAVTGITEETRVTSLRDLSGSLPLYLSILSSLPQEQVDHTQDVETHLLHWLASQEQHVQQVVLEGSLFTRSFDQDDLAAFHTLPEQQIVLYRWLIRLPFVHHRSIDGRHRYHRLLQVRLCHHFFQRTPQRYQAARRALAQHYRRVLQHMQEDEGQQASRSPVWRELVQALLAQLLALPDEASRVSVIELALWVAHQIRHEHFIVNVLRDLAQDPLLPQLNNKAGQTITTLLHYCETELTDPSWLAATEALFASIDHAPAFPSALLARMYCRRGVVYTTTNDFHQAIEQLGEALVSDPYCKEAFLLRGMVSIALHSYQEAIEDFDHVITLDDTNTLAYIHRGIAYWKQKVYERALADCDHVLALHPELDEVMTLRGLVYGEMHSKGRESESLNQLIAADPNNAQSYILRGLTSCSLRDYPHAIEDLDHALTFNVDPTLVYMARGHVYLEMGEIERAREDFLRSQEHTQDDAVGFLLEWLALCQERPRTQREGPMRLAEMAATSLDPHIAALCRGVAALLCEQYEQAIIAFEQASEFKPADGTAYFWKSLANAFIGHDEAAVAALEQAQAVIVPLPAILLTPLRWLEDTAPAFYRKYAALLVASNADHGPL